MILAISGHNLPLHFRQRRPESPPKVLILLDPGLRTSGDTVEDEFDSWIPRRRPLPIAHGLSIPPVREGAFRSDPHAAVTSTRRMEALSLVAALHDKRLFYERFLSLRTRAQGQLREHAKKGLDAWGVISPFSATDPSGVRCGSRPRPPRDPAVDRSQSAETRGERDLLTHGAASTSTCPPRARWLSSPSARKIGHGPYTMRIQSSMFSRWRFRLTKNNSDRTPTL